MAVFHYRPRISAIGCTAVLAGTALLLTSHHNGVAEQQNKDRTGAPGSDPVCTACHSGSNFAPTSSIALLDPATGEAVSTDATAAAEPPSTEPAAASPRQGEPSGWAVQVSSQRNEQAAWTAWRKLQARHGKLLGDSEAVVVRADLGARGVFYRVRINALPDQQDAAALCQRLKRAGTSCFVTAAGA